MHEEGGVEGARSGLRVDVVDVVVVRYAEDAHHVVEYRCRLVVSRSIRRVPVGRYAL